MHKVCKWSTKFLYVCGNTLTGMSMLDSTKVLCPFFDEIEILILGDSPSIFPSLEKCEILILYKKRKTTLLKQTNYDYDQPITNDRHQLQCTSQHLHSNT